jgi:hypothetical protein
MAFESAAHPSLPFRYRFAAAAWQTWPTMPRQRMMNPFRYRCISSSCAKQPFLSSMQTPCKPGSTKRKDRPRRRFPACRLSVLTLFKEDIRPTVSIRSHGIIPNLSAQGEKSFLRKALKKLFVVPSGNLALREPI